MRKKLKSCVRSGLCAVLATALWTGQATARELGVLPTIPQGATMGVPIAAPAPIDGIFLSSRTGLYNQSQYDQNGNKTATDVKIRDTLMQFLIVPGNKVLGGQYRAFLSAPLIHLEGEGIPTPFGLSSDSKTGLGSIEIRPLDISWEVSPGIFVNAGASVFTPGNWSANDLVNPGQNFWSVSPSVGFSYMRNGWNASAHLLYFINGKNRDNGYDSGDELYLNLTAMKDIGNQLSIGPVGFWRQQVTNDKNYDGAYGGFISGKSVSTGGGVSITKQMGPINLNFMYTKDLYTENTGGGDRFWFNIGIPIKVFGH